MTKLIGFICWRTGLIRARIKPVCRLIKPFRWQIKPVHVFPIFSLRCPLIFLICLFLLVFSCQRREKNTIMMYINRFFFQDRYHQTIFYPCLPWLQGMHNLDSVNVKFSAMSRAVKYQGSCQETVLKTVMDPWHNEGLKWRPCRIRTWIQIFPDAKIIHTKLNKC